MNKVVNSIDELQRYLGDSSPIISGILTQSKREITRLDNELAKHKLQRVKSGSVKDAVVDKAEGEDVAF